MKRILFLFCAMLSGMMAMAQLEINDVVTVNGARWKVVGENLFVNGSFDDGVDGWKAKDYSTAAVASNFGLSAEGGFDGGAYITTNGAGAGSEKTIRQSVAVENGKTYYFCVYTSGKAPSSNNYNYNALFKMTNATTEDGVLKAFEWPQGAGNTTSTWSKTEKVFTAEESHPYVGVRMGWNDKTKFDGFQIYEIEDAGIDISSLTSLIDEAADQLASYTEGTECYTLLSNAIQTAEAANPTTADELNNAKDALQSAMDMAAFLYKVSLLNTADILNGDFEVVGPLASGATNRYAAGEPWESNVSFANAGIRVQSSNLATSGGNVLVWRGSGNGNYISQLIKVNAGEIYKVTINQVAGDNAIADFHVGIGTEAGKYEVVADKVKLGKNQNGIKIITLTMPEGYGHKWAYFTLRNTANNSADSGSDPVSQIDYIKMEVVDPVDLAKENLHAVLDNATLILTNIGEGAFQYPSDGANAYNNAIETAEGVYVKSDATLEEVNEQIEKLNNLTLPALNAPAAGKKFAMVLTYAGWTYNNKAITYIANDRTDMGNYNIQYKEEANAAYAQAFTMTQVEGNKYKMSQTDNDGEERYISTGVPYGGNTAQIRTTTDAEKALVVEIIPTATEGVYNLKNTEANQYIGSQDAGVYTVNSHIDFNIVEAAQATATLKITDAHVGTFIAPFNIAYSEIPAVVTVWTPIAEGDTDGKVKFENVTEDGIKANVPYLVYSEEIVDMPYEGWGLAAKAEYASESLAAFVGTHVKKEAPVGSYILQNNSNVLAFYQVKNEGLYVGKNRCYMTSDVTSEARSFVSFDFGGMETAVENIKAEAEAKAEIYDLNGRRVQKATKGLYIINGKKVIK